MRIAKEKIRNASTIITIKAEMYDQAKSYYLFTLAYQYAQDRRYNMFFCYWYCNMILILILILIYTGTGTVYQYQISVSVSLHWTLDDRFKVQFLANIPDTHTATVSLSLPGTDTNKLVLVKCKI